MGISIGGQSARRRFHGWDAPRADPGPPRVPLAERRLLIAVEPEFDIFYRRKMAEKGRHGEGL